MVSQDPGGLQDLRGQGVDLVHPDNQEFSILPVIPMVQQLWLSQDLREIGGHLDSQDPQGPLAHGEGRGRREVEGIQGLPASLDSQEIMGCQGCVVSLDHRASQELADRRDRRETEDQQVTYKRERCSVSILPLQVPLVEEEVGERPTHDGGGPRVLLWWKRSWCTREKWWGADTTKLEVQSICVFTTSHSSVKP